MIGISLPDRDEAEKIRFVPNDWFALPNASDLIECEKPADWTNEDPAQTPVFSTRDTALGKLCEHRVLSRQAEKYLFLRMNYEKSLANQTAGELREIHLARAKGLRDRIILANGRLLVSMASHFSSSAVTTDDLVSEGQLPLMRAVELFDVSRGWNFSTYATHVLRNHFRRIGQKRTRRNKFASAMHEETVAQIPDEHIPAPIQEDLTHRQRTIAEDFLAELPEIDRLILKGRFGFDEATPGKIRSFAEVAKDVGLSKERVRVRAHRALEQLRELALAQGAEFPEIDGLLSA